MYVLAARNYFGIGVNYAKHKTCKSAEDEALGRGKWAHEKPLKHYQIHGPFDKAPSIAWLREHTKLPLGPSF